VRVLGGLLIALLWVTPASFAQTPGDEQILTTPMTQAQTPPRISVRLISIQPFTTDVLGAGVATAFEVTNHGARGIERMQAQFVARNQGDDRLVFKVEWERKRAVRSGETITMTSRHSTVDGGDIPAAINAKLMVTLDIYKIAFADGETVSYKSCFLCLF
jgi:hypothetical protein